MRTPDVFRICCESRERERDGEELISSENYISQEYNAFDWPRFFLGIFNNAFRSMSHSSTTIDNPHLLVYMVTGKMTDLGRALQNMKTISNSLTGMGMPGLVKKGLSAASYVMDFLMPVFTGEYKDANVGAGSLFHKRSETYHRTHNIYKELFFNPKRIDFQNDYKDYVGYVDNFCKGLKFLRENYNKKITRRELTIGEKNTLKLFRPNEIFKDMQEAQNYVQDALSTDPKLKKQWEGLYKKAEGAVSEYVKYILDNVKTSVIEK